MNVAVRLSLLQQSFLSNYRAATQAPCVAAEKTSEISFRSPATFSYLIFFCLYSQFKTCEAICKLMTLNSGLTELYRGDDPIVEYVKSGLSPPFNAYPGPTNMSSVVAVHGLNGDPFRTWTSEGSDKMWLKDPDLLPFNLENSRILTYGYNANVTAVFGKTSSDSILLHAHTLVAQLVADREVSPAWQ